VFVFLDISLRALHRSLRAVFWCLIYDFFHLHLYFFCFNSVFWCLDISLWALHRSCKVLFVVFYVAISTSNAVCLECVIALTCYVVGKLTRVWCFSGVRDAVLMCNKICFLHDSVHIHEDGSSEILRNLQEFEDAARVVVQLQVSGAPL